jgi:hypothetical protein
VLAAGVLVLIWAAVSAHAQTSELLIGWDSCQQMIDECKEAEGQIGLTDEIYDFAHLGADHPGRSIGTCYVHDNETPPGTSYPYACFNYVKISTLPNPKGYDNGTGCVDYVSPSPGAKEASRHQAAEILRQLCASGACCCPQVVKQPCGTDTDHSVSFHDSFTGTCCTFPNHCSIPSGWPPSGWQTPGSADCH